MPGQNNTTQEIPPTYKILAIVLFVIILIGMYIFYLNPYHILNYIRVPISIFYLLVLFCVIIFIERFIHDPMVVDKNSFGEMFLRFSLFFKSYVYYILIFLLFSVVTYFIYKYARLLGEFLVTTSLPLTLILVVLVLALFSNYSKNHTMDNALLELVKDFIMYIPCLLTDTIDFIKKDYDETPSSVFIVFIILIIYCLVFYVSPVIKKELYKNDGVLLVENQVYLNKTQLSLTTNELRERVFDNMPFYDRWTQTILYNIYDNSLNVVKPVEQSSSSFSLTSMQPGSSYSIENSRNNNAIPDSKTRIFYENFTTLMNEDTRGLTETYNYMKQIEQRIFNVLLTTDNLTEEEINDLKTKPEQLRDYLKSVIQNEPYLLSFVEKLGLIYAASLATRDGVLATVTDSMRPMTREVRVYRYSISIWVFLHKIEKTDTQQVILSYGSLPSLYYNSNEEPTLSLEYLDYSLEGGGKSKKLYVTNRILFQRWNNIVINYNYGTVDLFINNNLVGTYKNVSPQIQDDDLLVVGSGDNSNIGGICNVKYYPTPLSASKINTIYTQFNNKDSPI